MIRFHFESFWHLLWGMVARDLRGRYMGSFGGKAWNILYPLLMILIYTLVFSGIIRARFPAISGPFGYALYLCSGLLPWLAIDDSFKRSTPALVNNMALIQNLPFPKEILVLQYVISSSVTLIISLAILIVLELIAGVPLQASLLMLPPVILVQVMFMMGPALLLSVLHVYLRDTEQIVSIVLSLVFWLIPVVYVPSILPEWVRAVVYKNPLTHLVALYRWILLPYPQPDMFSIAYVVAVSCSSFILGLIVFRRLSKWVPDNL